MKRFLTLFLVLLTLCACTPTREEPQSESGYGLWFGVRRDSGRAEPFSVAREMREWGGEPSAWQLMDALLKGPQEEGNYNPFPNGASVRGIEFDEERATIRVDMSEQYGGLAGYDLTVADSCIALTLCQLPGVEHVEVMAAGEPIPYRDRQQIGYGDLLIAGADEYPENRLVTLYFPHPGRESLVAEYRPVAYAEGQGAEILIDELLKGPAVGTEGTPLPFGTQVLDLSVANGVCQVDLSREFLSDVQQNEQAALVNLYAVVNSLCTLSEVSRVRILIEGESPENYAGVSLKNALPANYDLLR